jgi:H2-forming N5,N10-methylenetetrahydromethanopterin dehydrogenase-like enzyme
MARPNRAFLDKVEAAISDDAGIHLVTDDYATHEAKPIRGCRT